MTKKEFYQSAIAEVASNVKVSEQEVFDWLTDNPSWTVDRLCLFTFVTNQFPSPDNSVETYLKEHGEL